jgi:predicted metalloprotease with PDZ domain
MPITYEANFEAGSLGLSLTQENTVVSVASGGQAESQGVRVDDLIISVSTVSVRGLTHEALLGLVKSQTRPMTLVFERKGEDLPVAQVDAGSTPTFSRLAGSPLLRAPSFLSSGQSMMKSVLGAGAQAVRAIDSTINRAIDDSAKQAKVCTLI